MPIHDWTRACDSVVHSFQFAWRVHLSAALNSELLPETHYSQIITVALPETPRRTYAKGRIAVYQSHDHRPVAEIGFVEPADKSDRLAVEWFVAEAAKRIEAGIHLQVVDLFPPGNHDPRGLHDLIWAHFGDAYVPPAQKPLTAAAYRSGPIPTAYLEPLAIGDPLPTMPLFLTPDRYINVPLEPAYAAAWRGTPRFWQAVVEGREPAPAG